MQSKAVEGFHSEEQQQAQRLAQQTPQTQQHTQTQVLLPPAQQGKTQPQHVHYEN